MGTEAAKIDARLRERLDLIAKLQPTIDLTKRESYVEAAGWHIDAREVPLLPEPPGPPTANGSFNKACELLKAYAFPPPRLIRGRFDPEAPLDSRAMLLTATYLWLTFELPVRVSRVIDVSREGKDGPETVWGYSYQTLAGHLERGEITFEIVKHVNRGDVVFRIHSFSQTDHIANPIYRLGFRLVGRRLQRRFAEESLSNMQRLVASALSSRASPLAT